jgi:predicted glycosyltransferase
MRILVDIGHPAQVHLFRHAIKRWQDRGHEVIIAARNKDIALRLLTEYGFSYAVTSKARPGIGLVLDIIEHDWRLLRLAVHHKSEVLIGSTSSVGHVARLLGARSIVFNEDNANVDPIYVMLTYPFAHTIVTPACLNEDHGAKHVIYDGNHELAYLHPNVYSPNPAVLNKLSVTTNDPFFILRFVTFKATHDWGEANMDKETRRRLVDLLSAKGRVFICSEGLLEEEFEPYRLRISLTDIHDALYYATMFVGDSQSMTIEAAVLGTPSIRCNTFVGRLSVIEELEHKYGLTYGFLPKDEDRMFDKIVKLLSDDNLKETWQQKRKKMLAEKIDVTEWMVDFVENYPL